MNQDPENKVIRITAEEANSQHVDDLLTRQANLRGEMGVARKGKRAWYYQSWVVFLIVGMTAALGGGLILEPYYEDHLHLQGPIENMSASGDWIEINGERILLSTETRETTAGGKGPYLDSSKLSRGQEIGVYCEIEGMGSQAMAFAVYVDPKPAPLPPATKPMTLEELSSRSTVIGLLIFPTIAGMIGLAIGAADGIICRLPRRAFFCGFVGLIVGVVGGFFFSIVAGMVYGPVSDFAMKKMHGGGGFASVGFGLQVIGRAFAWALAGLAMGLGQGIALRSKRLLVYGLLGGAIGGLFGGLLFDPIDMIFLADEGVEANVSRLVGFAVIGAGVGAMIGIVELLSRDAWLQMTQGCLTGKEFLLFKDVMNVGSSPRSDIYLFNDQEVTEQHAVIRLVGDTAEIEGRESHFPVYLNDRPVNRSRLRHGDQIMIGRTIFVFNQRNR